MPDPIISRDVLHRLCLSIHWLQLAAVTQNQVHLVSIIGMAIVDLLCRLQRNCLLARSKNKSCHWGQRAYSLWPTKKQTTNDHQKLKWCTWNPSCNKLELTKYIAYRMNEEDYSCMINTFLSEKLQAKAYCILRYVDHLDQKNILIAFRSDLTRLLFTQVPTTEMQHKTCRLSSFFAQISLQRNKPMQKSEAN